MGSRRIDDHRIRPTLLLPHDYVADATNLIRQARRRVYFMCLIVRDDIETAELIGALKEAARRGVRVDVAADAFTYGDMGGIFVPLSYRGRRRRDSSRLAKSLTEAGARFTWLGAARWRPFRGRTHIKFCVVDDVVYSFGGVNLYDRGVRNVDYMFKVEDAVLARRLAKVYTLLRKSSLGRRSHQSFAIKFGPNRVLVDAGRAGDSVIYERACDLASRSERVVLVSQYCPDGRLGRLLRSVPHEMYFNPPSNASGLNALMIRIGMLFSRNRTLYRRPDYLHAKCIVFHLDDGTKAAITGSHNFAAGGVRLGTREIALYTVDPAVIDQLERFIDEHVRRPSLQLPAQSE